MQVNSNLKKMSDDAEGILRPDPVPFIEQSLYRHAGHPLLYRGWLLMFPKGAIGLGRQRLPAKTNDLYSHKYMRVSTRLTAYTATEVHGKINMPLFLR